MIENGATLLDICLEKNLFVANTFFRHKKIHTYTWQKQELRSMIDLVLVDERLKNNFVDTRVYRGTNVETDHYLVICQLYGPFSHWCHLAHISITELERIKVERLQDSDVKDEYKRRLKDELCHTIDEEHKYDTESM